MLVCAAGKLTEGKLGEMDACCVYLISYRKAGVALAIDAAEISRVDIRHATILFGRF
jgi:hypothetical protein